MSRAQVDVDQNQLPRGTMAGASVAVKIAGRNSSLATIFSDQQSGGTLANPFVTASGRVAFWVPGQQDVDVTVTPTTGSPATVANQHATAAVGQHQTLTAFGGKVMNWYQS